MSIVYKKMVFSLLINLLGMCAYAQYSESIINRAGSNGEDVAVREITADGIPDTIRYMSNDGSGLRQFNFPSEGCPNGYTAQSYKFHVPYDLAEDPTSNLPKYFGMSSFGVSIDGIVFDPNSAEFYDPSNPKETTRDQSTGWRYEAIIGKSSTDEAKRILGVDVNNAHVQPGGKLHLHGIPWAVSIDDIGNNKYGPNRTLAIVGYAADGYPIVSKFIYDTNGNLVSAKSGYSLRIGSRHEGAPENGSVPTIKGNGVDSTILTPNGLGPSGKYDGTYTQDYAYQEDGNAYTAHLDECNGMYGRISDEVGAQPIYYYVLTEEFPYIGRCWRGDVLLDAGFAHTRPSSGNGPDGMNDMSPPPAGENRRMGGPGDAMDNGDHPPHRGRMGPNGEMRGPDAMSGNGDHPHSGEEHNGEQQLSDGEPSDHPMRPRRRPVESEENIVGSDTEIKPSDSSTPTP